MDLEERPDPQPGPGNAGLRDGGRWRSGEIAAPARPAGEEAVALCHKGRPQPTGGLILLTPAPRTALCVCVRARVCWGVVIPRGDLFVVQPQNLES